MSNVLAGGHRKPNFSFSSSLDLDVTCSSQLTLLAMALSATKVSCFKRAAYSRIRSKSRLMCGSLVSANKRDSTFAVVHGCFPEGGYSILSAFSREPSPAILQDN